MDAMLSKLLQLLCERLARQSGLAFEFTLEAAREPFETPADHPVVRAFEVSDGRGWAIELGNIKAGGNTVVSDNIITNDTQNQWAAIKLEHAFADNQSDGAGSPG